VLQFCVGVFCLCSLCVVVVCLILLCGLHCLPLRCMFCMLLCIVAIVFAGFCSCCVVFVMLCVLFTCVCVPLCARDLVETLGFLPAAADPGAPATFTSVVLFC
jgi:hypothetical protein